MPTIALGGAYSYYETLRNGFAVPLSSFATPASTRAVVGTLRLSDGDLQMMFDARYANMFNRALAAIEDSRPHLPDRLGGPVEA